MEKIAILVDSASDISGEALNIEGIYVLPLYVNLDGKYYKDREEISPEEFYEWMRSATSLPKTSAPAPSDAIAIYKRIKNDGYNKVIVLTISSTFSSTFNLFDMTKNDDLETYIFDTGNLTMSDGFFAIYIKELIEDGYTFDQIIAKINDKKNDSRVFFSLESFKYITAGGRFPKPLSKVGDALSVKPILSVDPMEGAIKLVKLVRGERKVLSEFRKIAREELKNTRDYYFFTAHGGYEEGLEKLEDLFQDLINNAKMHISIQISPTLGAHTGPGLYGFGYFKVD